jgi:phosphoribosylaminoimidazole-succinocarboxamide synthase
MTSVKDLRVDTAPTETALGTGAFAFSDRYSVFDWGEMPDHVPRKGASLCTMGAFNFELLEASGVPTHYRGVSAERVATRETVALADAPEPPTEMVINLTRVPDLPFMGADDPAATHGGYDYDAYHAAAGSHYLVPLEIVFRNSVPVGSSLRRRRTPAEFGLDAELGLYADSWPEEPVDLPEPVVEFSTKYEERDRYLTRAAADDIAGQADVAELEATARDVNRVLTERAADAGFVHEDGKIECLYVDGEVRVADVAGTFDENRFAFDGREVSKEVVRQHYRRVDPEWVEAVSDAKRDADERGVADWRSLCEQSPESLDEDVLSAVSAMYAAGANRYTGHEWFDAPPLGEALAALA